MIKRNRGPLANKQQNCLSKSAAEARQQRVDGVLFRTTSSADWGKRRQTGPKFRLPFCAVIIRSNGRIDPRRAPPSMPGRFSFASVACGQMSAHARASSAADFSHFIEHVTIKVSVGPQRKRELTSRAPSSCAHKTSDFPLVVTSNAVD